MNLGGVSPLRHQKSKPIFRAMSFHKQIPSSNDILVVNDSEEE
jgi:hypothetical protein